MTAWDAVFDGLERELEAVETALASGAVDVVIGDLVVPGDLGPLPEESRPRATELQLRLASAELGLALALERARRAMVLGDSSPSAGPSLFDARH